MAVSECNSKINEQGQELASHGTEDFPVACYHDDLEREDVPWHWHEELELILVAEGEALVAAGQEKYVVREGSGMFINSGILHAAWRHGGGACRFHSIVFHPELVGGTRESVFWKKYVRPLMEDPSFACMCLEEPVGWHGEALEALEQAWQSIAREEPGYEFAVRANLSEIIRLLVQRRPPVRKQLSEKMLRNEERMKLMLRFIRDHCEEEITVEQIARSASVSTSECLRCFHDTIGTAPIRYVLQYRIQRAAELLFATDLKIADIGMRCGFQDMSYFARSFRKLKGSTPSEYRMRSGGPLRTESQVLYLERERENPK